MGVEWSEGMEFPAGTPAWTHVGTPNLTPTSRFYCALFGWQAVTAGRPLEDAGSYWNFQRDGKSIAGIGPLMPGSRSPFNKALWSLIMTVDDADAAAKTIAANGGTVLLQPRDIYGGPVVPGTRPNGRFGVFSDPSGAEFGIWQPGQIYGFEVIDEPTSYTWCEVTTHDAAVAEHFYKAVFGWDRKGDEWFLPDGERSVAGLVHVTENVLPQWLVYFAVTSTDATVAKALELGATLSLDPIDLPGRGRAAVLDDPHGAAFAIVQR